ncbi:hypothetical protein [Anaerosporobacter sp.]|uniref:hypothetical protein n=1 Tax=Anaerosporobacter sp. TaxID=1872529 RepID=UPI00286F1DB9|nr:hypothetical protein [Anaerosporobacter sp.]
MDYAIGLYFDFKTTNKITKIIEAVAQNGANTYMVDTKIPPHLTLSYFQTDHINPIINILNTHTTNWHANNIFFASLGIFVPNVLFIAPVFTEYLQNLNIEINNLIESVATHGDNGHYLPNQWVPHTALAVRLTDAELKASFETATAMFTAFEGQAVKLFLAECNPYKEIATWELHQT